MKFKLTPLFCILCLFAVGQDKEDFRKVIFSRTLNTSPDAGFQSFNSSVKLEANNTGTKAVANIAIPIAKSSMLLNFNVEQPVSSTGRVTPITLDGLSNKTSFTFGFQAVFDYSENITLAKTSYAQQMVGVRTLMTGKLTRREDIRFLQLSELKIPGKIYIGIKLGLTQQEFKYLQDTSISFLQVEESKTAGKGSITVGGLWGFGTIAATYIYQDGHEASDQHSFYFPVNGTNVQIEKEYFVGPPTHKSDHRLRIEYMSIGNSGIGKVLRINPNINISFPKKKGSLEIPVFFLSHKGQDKEPNLNGGIFASYLTDGDYTFRFKKANWGLGVFIGGSITDLFKP